MRAGGGDSTPESCARVEETAHQNRARGWRRQHTRIARGGGGDSTPESWAKHSCSESRRNCLAIDTPWTQHPSRAVTSAPKFVNRTWPFVLPHRRRVAARSIATRVWATDKTGPGTVHSPAIGSSTSSTRAAIIKSRCYRRSIEPIFWIRPSQFLVRKFNTDQRYSKNRLSAYSR